MNKAELVAAIADKTELSKKDAEAALKAFTDVVAEELKKGEKIQLPHTFHPFRFLPDLPAAGICRRFSRKRSRKKNTEGLRKPSAAYWFLPKAEVLSLAESTKKEDAKEMFRYL